MCSLPGDILGGPGARYLLQGGMFEAKKGVFINKVALHVYDLTTFSPRLFRKLLPPAPLAWHRDFHLPQHQPRPPDTGQGCSLLSMTMLVVMVAKLG